MILFRITRPVPVIPLPSFPHHSHEETFTSGNAWDETVDGAVEAVE